MYQAVERHRASVGLQIRCKGHAIVVTKGGISIDGGAVSNLARFSGGGVVGTGYKCFAALVGGELLIFEGASMGPTMIDERALFSQLGLAV